MQPNDFETIAPDELAATTGGFSAQDGMNMAQQFMQMIGPMIQGAGGGGGGGAGGAAPAAGGGAGG